MTEHTITREAVNRHAELNRHNEKSDFSEDACLALYDDDADGDDVFTQLTAYLAGIDSVNTAHGIIINDDSVTFTTEGLDAVRIVYDRVMDDYNGSNGRSTRDADSPWALYGLSGDDAVDECGSHPVIAIDWLLEILNPV